jgi:hypothetical protein
MPCQGTIAVCICDKYKCVYLSTSIRKLPVSEVFLLYTTAVGTTWFHAATNYSTAVACADGALSVLCDVPRPHCACC